MNISAKSKLGVYYDSKKTKKQKNKVLRNALPCGMQKYNAFEVSWECEHHISQKFTKPPYVMIASTVDAVNFDIICEPSL